MKNGIVCSASRRLWNVVRNLLRTQVWNFCYVHKGN